MKQFLLLSLISYFLGSLNISYIFAKFLKNIDIRDFGSGNPGTTNVLRVLGFWPALFVFIIDILKGVFCVFLATYFGTNTYMLFSSLFVIVGHNWPLWLRFKGGKGVATSVGMAFALNFKIALIIFLISFFIFLRTKTMSLASLTFVFLLPLFFYLFGLTYIYVILAVIICFLAVIRHKTNIINLMHKKERKINFK